MHEPRNGGGVHARDLGRCRVARLPLRQAQILEDGRVDWKPLVDGFEIPDQPRDLLRRGQFSRVPTIIGVTRDEGLAFVDRSFPSGVDTLQYERDFCQARHGSESEPVAGVVKQPARINAAEIYARRAAECRRAIEKQRAIADSWNEVIIDLNRILSPSGLHGPK